MCATVPLMPRTRRLIASFFAGSACALGSCDAAQRPTPAPQFPSAPYARIPSLIDTDWRCVELLDAQGAPIDLSGGDAPTLRVAADGRANGFAGVNRYSCDAQIGNAIGAEWPLAFGPVLATSIAGLPERMMLEQAFTQMLESVRSSRVSFAEGSGAAMLTLRSERGICARFTAVADPDMLRGFAHLVSGEWTTTLDSGDVLSETWSWEPDGRSIRVRGASLAPARSPWWEEQVFFVEKERGEVRVKGSSSYRNGAFEGTVVFARDSAEASITIMQDANRRALVRRWRFLGTDRFETELLESIAGQGLVPLATWTYTRRSDPAGITPSR